MDDHHGNIVRIRAVHNALISLNKKIVFVGGATVSLYADRISFEARPTKDVDVVIEILSYAEETALEDQLRKIGFKNDVESSIRNRFIYQNTIVDIIPTNGNWTGFKNDWYPEAYNNAIDYSIDEQGAVKIFPAPYFLATKLEAFGDRGNSDGYTSKDFEDIVFVLENRRIIWQELNSTHGELKLYLVEKFQELMENKSFEEWVIGHVDPMGSPPAHSFIIPRLKEFVSGN